ncbi:MAG: hypothetical protein ACRDP7_45890 [Trebonia sp.]
MSTAGSPHAGVVRSSCLAALTRLANRHNVRVRGRCRCPLCSYAEQQVRTAMGMARKHPEWLTRELRAHQENYLAALADQLWPDEEYTAIITELRRQEGQS